MDYRPLWNLGTLWSVSVWALVFTLILLRLGGGGAVYW